MNGSLIEDSLKAAELKESYYEFFKHFWDVVITDNKFVDNFHIKYICDELQIVCDRVIMRLPKLYDLCINVSPGESKSTLVTRMLNAWVWAKDPTIPFVAFSHSPELVTSLSTACRDIIMSDEYQRLFPEVKIRKDSFAKKSYKTTKGGVRHSFQISKDAIGFHYLIKVIDDPVDKSTAKKADKIEEANNKIKQHESRKSDANIAVDILCMQRLATDDPASVMIKKINTKHVCLPATNEYPILPKGEIIEWQGKKYTLEEIYELNGGYMNPKRKGPKEMDKLKNDPITGMSSYEIASQYGQQPVAREGNWFVRKWVQIATYDILDPDFWSSPEFMVVDTASGVKEQNDPSGFWRVRLHRNRAYVMDRWNGKLRGPALSRHIRDYCQENGLDIPVFIEPKNNGQTVADQLVEYGINAIQYEMPAGSKEERFYSHEHFFEAGRLMFIKSFWNKPTLDSLCGFPVAKNDEDVDLSSMTADIVKNQRQDKGAYDPVSTSW